MTSNTIQYIVNISTIVGAIAAVSVICVAFYQIIQSNRIARGQFLLEIKKQSKNHDYVHLNLRPGGCWRESEIPEEAWAKIDDYMGFFETCEILMDRKSLQSNDFAKLFAYRVENIILNSQITEHKIYGEEKSWITFKNLVKRLEKMEKIESPLK